ncbi:ribonuclease H [Senna tora]|uniref:Ribonuclease H n=1 Tax=Senna tora TaxID=362788 RepID=A0A834SYC2_9FABA|nr:ribonuclease H [Senna tora]
MNSENSSLGKVLKIDVNTTLQARGKCARMCIEVDLTKLLLSKYSIHGKIRKTEFEGLHLICFECGVYGHDLEHCPIWKAKQEKAKKDKEEGVSGKDNGKEEGNILQEPGEGRYGAWMTVTKPIRPRRPKVDNQKQEKVKKIEASKGGSRFAALESNEENGDNQEIENHEVPSEIILFWSCRGAAGRKFALAFKELKRLHKPDIVFLFETRCNGLKGDIAINKLCFNHKELNDAKGFAGGIWALWTQDINASCLVNHEQFIQLEIENSKGEKWSIIATYANPHLSIRNSVWPVIQEICSNYLFPLIVARDFNENCGHLRAKGWKQPERPFFTWEGPQRPDQDKLYKKLDRVLCSANWRTNFSDASVKLLTKIHSDHHPILVDTEDNSTNPAKRPFRFESCWMQHADFKHLLKDNWEDNLEHHQMMEKLANHLKVWNRDIFGNIKNRKNRIMRSLHGIQ